MIDGPLICEAILKTIDDDYEVESGRFTWRARVGIADKMSFPTHIDLKHQQSSSSVVAVTVVVFVGDVLVKVGIHTQNLRSSVQTDELRFKLSDGDLLEKLLAHLDGIAVKRHFTDVNRAHRNKGIITAS